MICHFEEILLRDETIVIDSPFILIPETVQVECIDPTLWDQLVRFLLGVREGAYLREHILVRLFLAIHQFLDFANR